MALFISYKDGDQATLYLPFTIGEKFDKMKYEALHNNINLLYADGHELDHILHIFQNIPYRSGFTTWKGEIANFIASNLMETK